MGMNQTLYVMTGIRFKRDELPFDLFDDKYLPYIEGHPETDISIIYGETDYVYVGEVMIQKASDDYDDISKTIETPDKLEVAAKIHTALYMKVSVEGINNWVFTIWM